MTHDEFRSVFDNVEYSKEFIEKMEKKLASEPSAGKKKENYSEAVTGVEQSRDKRITRIVSRTVACAAAAAICVGVGYVISNNKKPQLPESSVYSNMTTTTTTATTPQVTTTTVTTVLTASPVASAAYENKLGLTAIDVNNDSDEVLIGKIKEYLTCADKNSFDNSYPDEYPDSIAISAYGNESYDMKKRFENGDSFNFGDTYEYWAFEDDNFTMDKVREDFYSVYADDYEGNLNTVLKENEGKLYGRNLNGEGNEFPGSHDFSGDIVTIMSRSDDTIIATVETDYTVWVTNSYQGYFIPDELRYLVDGDYKYTYTQEVELTLEEDGWRVSRYIPYMEMKGIALDDCYEFNYILEHGYDDFEDSENTEQDGHQMAVDSIGKWYVDDYGDTFMELNIYSVDGYTVTFDLSSYRAGYTDIIVAELGNTEDSANVAIFNSDVDFHIQGSLEFNSDNSITVTILDSEHSAFSCGTTVFNTRA